MRSDQVTPNWPTFADVLTHVTETVGYDLPQLDYWLTHTNGTNADARNILDGSIKAVAIDAGLDPRELRTRLADDVEAMAAAARTKHFKNTTDAARAQGKAIAYATGPDDTDPIGPTARQLYADNLANEVMRAARAYTELGETLRRIAETTATIGDRQGLRTSLPEDIPAAVLRAVRTTDTNVSLDAIVTAAAEYARHLNRSADA